MSQLLTTNQVADILGVHRNSVAYWCLSGHIKALPRHTSRAPWRIPRAELERILAEGLPPSPATLRAQAA